MENSIANTLEHVATIDFCYWRLGELNSKLSKPKHPIERMIDTACGYDEYKEVREEVISLLKQIIDSKKAIGYDCTGDNFGLINLNIWRNNMKQIAITIGEMKRLQELGVDCSKASMCWEYLLTAEAIMNGTFDDADGPYLLANTGFKHDFPAFTLQEILDLLPKEIRYNGNRYLLSIYFIDELWVIRYEDAGGYFAKSYCYNNILDVAYKMLVWCLENGYEHLIIK